MIDWVIREDDLAEKRQTGKKVKEGLVGIPNAEWSGRKTITIKNKRVHL